MSNLPKPSQSSDPVELQKTLDDVIRWISDTHQGGTAHVGMTQDDINAVSSQEAAGRQVLNETTGDLNYFSIDPSTKAITVKVV